MCTAKSEILGFVWSTLISQNWMYFNNTYHPNYKGLLLISLKVRNKIWFYQSGWDFYREYISSRLLIAENFRSTGSTEVKIIFDGGGLSWILQILGSDYHLWTRSTYWWDHSMSKNSITIGWLLIMLILNMIYILLYNCVLVKKITDNIWFSLKNQRISDIVGLVWLWREAFFLNIL